MFVEGRLTFDSWTAQDGSKRSKHRVTVENFQFLGGPGGGQAGGSNQSKGHDSGPPAATDDDIPF